MTKDAAAGPGAAAASAPPTLDSVSEHLGAATAPPTADAASKNVAAAFAPPAAAAASGRQAASSVSACFVIPTYNEADNVVPLLRRLTALHPEPETAFLIVDDNSPDGTAALVNGLAAADRRIHLLEGPRRGLGTAYLRGIRHALEVLGATAVLQMDADFSHDPADAGRLLNRLAAGADLALASRYVAGGSLDPRWGLGRRMLSGWGNRLARCIAGLHGVRDCTSGFKAIRASALEAADLGAVAVRGYAFQVALLHSLLRSGAKAVEVPIHFRERLRGQTKLGLRDVLEFFFHLWQLRLGEHGAIVKFGCAGLFGAAVNLGSFHLMLTVGLHKFLASPIATEIAILCNFFINNHWTFGGRRMAGSKGSRGLKYNLVALATLSLSYATFIGLSLLFPEASPVLLQACGIAPAAALNYLLHFYWTFRETAAGAVDGSARRPAPLAKHGG